MGGRGGIASDAGGSGKMPGAIRSVDRRLPSMRGPR
eukprot:CAMPEP_0115839194 /NCGR_PEP_ID=MMETSP0287-20121206/6126_1 /TAXON_ID=412157 /ORGANISM="Chrysochromulina rotalis, Strain UIO044" /LENGTH=35 /DNA_ID= /DNA_START= /DNA_END= /DNA_ORIENTATION=